MNIYKAIESVLAQKVNEARAELDTLAELDDLDSLDELELRK